MKSVFAFLISNMLVASVQAGLKIKLEEFQYVHCVANKIVLRHLYKHYVIDIRDENKHQLYTATHFQKTKATELKNLRLIDENLLVNTLNDVDVSWISAANKLTFKLNILDNGGYSMDGTVSEDGVETPVSCVDSSLE